ncbi:hypothetical protein [Nonomuraea sp. NPDC049141]|uniref:hypothetical protein n=1 Tax=unclassified Nonomuraea TaxID=2593643 RepID=UPI0033FDBAAB
MSNPWPPRITIDPLVIPETQAVPYNDPQTPPPTSPDQQPPAEPGMIPLTVAEIERLFNAVTTRTPSRERTAHWSAWRRRHQARARWFHQRTRLTAAYIQLI